MKKTTHLATLLLAFTALIMSCSLTHGAENSLFININKKPSKAILSIENAQGYGRYMNKVQSLELISFFSLKNVNLNYNYKIQLKGAHTTQPNWSNQTGIILGNKGANAAIITSMRFVTQAGQLATISKVNGNCHLENNTLIKFNKSGRSNCMIYISPSVLQEFSRGGKIIMPTQIAPSFSGSASALFSASVIISMN
tara:strand:- start:375 stop:965 length:591 start_codon:yes stop_codon:yes gene_type:complete